MVRVPFSQLAGRIRTWKGLGMSRLPDHYYNHAMQVQKEGERVHAVPIETKIADYTLADEETLRVERVNDPPITVVYPPEADEGIWGGEGIVKGFVKKRNFYGNYYSTWWYPTFYQSIHYSEILDKHMRVVVTERTNRLVDKMQGFDNYLLKTPVEDLKSRLALRLRRKLLMSLALEDYYPNDAEKHRYIKEKYSQFKIPLEEAEWFGLTTLEALTKQRQLDALKFSEERRPMKELFTQQLLDEIRQSTQDEKKEK